MLNIFCFILHIPIFLDKTGKNEPMIYTDKLVEIQDGLALYVPDPELVRTTYEQLFAKDKNTPFPFWAQIWPAAKAMSAFLLSEPRLINGKQVLELGAGIGLPSFSISELVSEILISDHASEAVALIEKNIQFLGLQNVKAMYLDWNHFPDQIHAEIILLSDLNYAPDQFISLLALIRRFLGKGSAIVLSTPERITASPFTEALQPFIKRSVLHTVEHKLQTVDISILILSN